MKPLTTQQIQVVEAVMKAPDSHQEKVENDNEDKAAELLKQILLPPRDVVMTKRIGAGAFGEVFKGCVNGQSVAVKTMIDVSENNLRSFRSEILLTATLRHPNIVNFIGT